MQVKKLSQEQTASRAAHLLAEIERYEGNVGDYTTDTQLQAYHQVVGWLKNRANLHLSRLGAEAGVVLGDGITQRAWLNEVINKLGLEVPPAEQQYQGYITRRLAQLSRKLQTQQDSYLFTSSDSLDLMLAKTQYLVNMFTRLHLERKKLVPNCWEATHILDRMSQTRSEINNYLRYLERELQLTTDAHDHPNKRFLACLAAYRHVKGNPVETASDQWKQRVDAVFAQPPADTVKPGLDTLQSALREHVFTEAYQAAHNVDTYVKQKRWETAAKCNATAETLIGLLERAVYGWETPQAGKLSQIQRLNRVKKTWGL